MITKEALETVQAVYTPSYIKEKSVIVGADILPEKEFYEKAKRCGLPQEHIAAFTFDIKGTLELLFDMDMPSLPRRCLLYFNEAIEDDIHLTFVYLHELGHIDWKLNGFDNVASSHAEREFYADLYAYEILSGHYKESIAEKWLRALGSAGGWYNKENDREELLEFWKRNRKTWRAKRL